MRRTPPRYKRTNTLFPYTTLFRSGRPTAELTGAVRQQTRAMKTAVATARSGDYAASLQSLDKIISGEGADKLAANLVAEWTRLKPEKDRKSTRLNSSH